MKKLLYANCIKNHNNYKKYLIFRYFIEKEMPKW